MVYEEVDNRFLIESSNGPCPSSTKQVTNYCYASDQYSNDGNRKFSIKHEPELDINNSFDVCESQNEVKLEGEIFTIEFVEEENNSQSTSAYCCKSCAYKTNNKLNLKRHVTARHSTEIFYSCYICNFKTDFARALTSHRKSHQNPKSYLCSDCNFQCVQLDTMRAHDRDHLIEKSSKKLFFCAHCDYRALFKFLLKLHLKTHSGEKSGSGRTYSCSLCTYETKRNRNLKWHHQRIHLGQEPFRCHICQLTCSTNGTLNRHIKTHFKEQYSIQCSKCDYKTLQNCALNFHMRRIHSKEPYRCSECNFETNNKHVLKRHVQSHSDVENII